MSIDKEKQQYIDALAIELRERSFLIARSVDDAASKSIFYSTRSTITPAKQQLAVLTSQQFDVLAALDQLKRVPSHERIYLLVPDAFLGESAKIAEEFYSLVDVVYDIRKQDGLFTEHERDNICWKALTYTGDIPAGVAMPIQKVQLSKAVTDALQKIMYGERALMPSVEFPIADCVKIADILMGKPAPELTYLASKKTSRAASWKVRTLSLIYLKPQGNEKVCAITDELETLSQVIDIWKGAIRLAGAGSIMELLALDKETIEKNISSRFIIDTLHRADEASGAVEMVKTYFAGVPKEDIINV